LFAEGRELLLGGHYAEACPKLEASQRAEPSVGTALNLGECYEKLGRTASAYGAFGDAARLARERGDGDRQEVAVARQKKLGAVLSRLVVRPPSSDVEPGLVIKLDDKALDPGVWGSGIPLDPGKYVLSASSAKGQTYREEIVLPKGPIVIDRRVVLVDVPPPVKAVVPPSVPVVEPLSSYEQQVRSDHVTYAKAGVLLLSAGFIGIGSGTAWGVAALAQNAEAKAHCDVVQKGACDRDGYGANNRAGAYADASTWSFVGGGVFLAAGATLFIAGVLQPSEKPRVVVMPVVAPRYSGLGLRMEF